MGQLSVSVTAAYGKGGRKREWDLRDDILPFWPKTSLAPTHTSMPEWRLKFLSHQSPQTAVHTLQQKTCKSNLTQCAACTWSSMVVELSQFCRWKAFPSLVDSAAACAFSTPGTERVPQSLLLLQSKHNRKHLVQFLADKVKLVQKNCGAQHTYYWSFNYLAAPGACVLSEHLQEGCTSWKMALAALRDSSKFGDAFPL